MWVIDCDKLDARLHEAGEEGDVAGQPVELGDDEDGLRAPGVSEGANEFGTVGAFPALDLDVLPEKSRVVRPEVRLAGNALPLEAKPRKTMKKGISYLRVSTKGQGESETGSRSDNTLGKQG